MNTDKIMIEKKARTIVNDVIEYYNIHHPNDTDKIKMKNMYNDLIDLHNKKRLNLFEYNDDMFYELFV